MSTGALKVEGLTKAYSGVTAVSSVSIGFTPGEITAVVGANGAGKTSLLDLLSGVISPTEGRVELDGKDVTSMSAWRRGRQGLFRGFQETTLFSEFTVRETLRVSAYRTHHYSPLSAVLRLPVSRRLDREVDEAVDRTAAEYGLGQWLDTQLKGLSLGMIKIVQLAAVVLAAPRWVLLDEPAAGLARAEVDNLGAKLREASAALPDGGFIVVEHDARLVSDCADRVIVMAGGEVSEDLRKDQAGWSDLLHAPSVSIPVASPSGVALAEVAKDHVEPPTRSREPGQCLDARGLVISYGRFEAVHGADISVWPGTLSVLVGTNGAGKSSVLNAMVGLRPPAAGQVFVDGKDVSRRAAHDRARDGVVLVPSGRALISTLTVAENLELTSRVRGDSDSGPSLEALDLFPELKSRLKQKAGTMSGGEQQMLAIARSVQLRPKYLLIDELSLGLNPVVVSRLVKALLELRDAGVGLLVVEQNAPFALSYSDEAFVMNRGAVAFHGPSAEAAARTDLFRPVFLDAAPAS